MAATGKARLFRRPDGKYLIYLPVDVAEDSQFPYHLTHENASVELTVTFDTKARKIILEERKEP